MLLQGMGAFPMQEKQDAVKAGTEMGVLRSGNTLAGETASSLPFSMCL